jgi:tRNA(His) 5'-end guanylyltransferase
MIHDKMGERMKGYEAAAQHYLTKRTPVIIRCDSKAGHTFTKHLRKPIDNIFREAMENAMVRTAKEIQGCYFAYEESDEVTFLLQDYETLETDAWFGYRTDKLCSITASYMTLYFNQEFKRIAEDYIWNWTHCMVPQSMTLFEEEKKYHTTLRKCIEKGLIFDARCFNIPKEEVVNVVLWRQMDSMRNSIQSIGHHYLSQKEMNGKNNDEVLAMLKEKGINYWETMPHHHKVGVCCYREDGEWQLDYNMPMLKGEDRYYLERLV